MYVIRSLVAAGLVSTAVVIASPVRAEEPNGLYLMTRFMGGSLEIDSYLFDGGQVVRGPAGDVKNFDFEQARSKAPGQTGDFSVSGNRLIVNWGDGAVSEGDLEPGTSGCFYFDAGLFCPAKTFATSGQDGTYSGGASGSAGAGLHSELAYNHLLARREL